MNQPATTSPVNWLTVKKYLAKLTSIALLFSATRGLITTLAEIFTFVSAIQRSTSLIQSDVNTTLRIFLVEIIRVAVEATYGVVLLVKPGHKVRFLHIIVGLVLFLIPYLITDTLLQQTSDLLLYQNPLSIYAQGASPSPNPAIDSATQALSDYQFQFQNYRTTHSQYLSDKNAFLTFQTLNAQETAIESTKKLLISRAETLHTYLRALRTKLGATPGITLATKESLEADLSAEESFLEEHLAQIPSLLSLEAINNESLKLEARYPQIQVLSYTTIYTIFRGEQTDISQKLLLEQRNLQNLVDQNATELNSDRISQWLKDTENKLAENDTSFAAAEKELSQIKPSLNLKLGNQRHFGKILSLLEETRTRLTQVVSFTQEIINRIKYS
ncbi:MAG: hypothetical protein HYS86_04825 [Candidatus Chisholmbacteria bacterium]|nr:hypothetical protein [Candidatus Chisholmbacteria bacterium]